MKTYKQFTSDPVTKLKHAMVQKKDAIQSASKDDSYNIIDKMMTKISKSHQISGKALHDKWVEKHNKTPDEWIKKQ